MVQIQKRVKHLQKLDFAIMAFIVEDLAVSDPVQRAVIMLMERTSTLEDEVTALKRERDELRTTLQNFQHSTTEL